MMGDVHSLQQQLVSHIRDLDRSSTAEAAKI